MADYHYSYGGWYPNQPTTTTTATNITWTVFPPIVLDAASHGPLRRLEKRLDGGRFSFLASYVSDVRGWLWRFCR